MTEFVHAHTPEQYAVAESLFRQYAAWLNIDLCFQNFDKELEELTSMYAAPNGGIILSKENDVFSGCVAVRKIDDETAELKRMYVRPEFQKKGIGEGLLHEAILLAEKAGYKKIRLDTLSHMIPAINLYKKNGFYEISAYYHNPETTAVYFEKTLKN